MSKKAIMEAIKKSLGDTLNEEVAEEISSYLDELVSDRAKASTLELEEQVEKLTKVNKSLKKKIQVQEKEFKNEAERFTQELAEAFAQKEAILFEELENYKEETVKVVEETAAAYRDAVEQMVIEESSLYKSELEKTMLESAKDFRLQQEAALAKDVDTYRSDVLGKLDEFLEAELPNYVASDIMEAAAKAEALEELTEGVVDVFKKKSINLDAVSAEALKEAHTEKESIAEAYNAKVKEAVALTAKVRELEKEVKITALTEGMTSPQKKRTRKLLEGASVADIERKFDAVKDYIIKESVAKPRKATPPARVVKQEELNEEVKKQITKIEESNKPAKSTGFEGEQEQWRRSLDRMNRRL